MKSIPVFTWPLDKAHEALQDLINGQVIGRTVLIP